MTVKLNVRDYPKRGGFVRHEVSVDAKDDAGAIQFALVEAQQKWPGGKVTAYDVVRDRTQPVEKRGPGRPKKDAA